MPESGRDASGADIFVCLKIQMWSPRYKEDKVEDFVSDLIGIISYCVPGERCNRRRIRQHRCRGGKQNNPGKGGICTISWKIREVKQRNKKSCRANHNASCSFEQNTDNQHILDLGDCKHFQRKTLRFLRRSLGRVSRQMKKGKRLQTISRWMMNGSTERSPKPKVKRHGQRIKDPSPRETYFMLSNP